MSKVHFQNVKGTPLKFHRLMQFLIMPVSFVLHLYTLISLFLAVANLKINMFVDVIRLFGLEGYTLAIVILMGYLLIQVVLVLQAWIHSFRWIKKSYFSTILHFLLLAVCSVGSMIFVYKEQLNVLIGMNLRAYQGVSINARVLFVIIVFIGIGLLMYSVLSISYYFNRRRLYRKLVVEQPKTEEPVEEAAPEPIPVAVPQVENTETPVEVIEMKQDEIEEMQEPVVEVTEVVEEPVIEEATEVVEEIAEEPIVEVTDTVEEEVQEVQAEEVEVTPVEEIQPEDIVSAPVKKEVMFCLQCGAKLKPGAKFCSNCGNTIES